MENTTSNFYPYYSLRLSFISLSLYLISPQLCYAAQDRQLDDTVIHSYQEELKRQRNMLREQGAQIAELKRIVDALTKGRQVKTLQQDKKASKTSNTIVKREQVVTARKSQNDQSKPQHTPDNQPVGQAPPKNANPIEVNAIPNDNVSGVLTGKGRLVLEPSIGYSYTDNNRVFLDAFSFIPALVVGLIDLREIKRHSFIGSVSARYGLTERWEVDLKIPYIGRNDSQRSRPVSIGVSEDEIFNASGHGLGDIELSTRYQLNAPVDGGPIYVANLVATIPTGTSPFEVEFMQSTPGAVFPTELPTGSGYVSIQPSLTAIYATDPGVFFGNISYGYNMDTDEDVGNVDPGDSAGVSFGLGVSLNERASMSLSYSHKHVLKSKINEMKIDGSQLDIGQLIIGYSFRYSEQTNISLSLAIGVTDDAQDTRLNFRLPVTF
ncbi:MAG: transporter [Paraglaciecola polaris]|uniref:transporter n=1 Tax=Paraglaciecola polaris TaxID=222814 RepID=UPI003003974E